MIIGAGTQSYPGWIATQREQLDLLHGADWAASFGERLVDVFLCEQVWEHLTEAEGRFAASLCFRYLRPGGYLRCAVPDGNFPNAAYQLMVRPGGPGPKDHAAADHKVLYDYQRLTATYCDAAGRFHYHQWSNANGPIYRSLMSDDRNKGGTIEFVSLIVDARKPPIVRRM